MNWYSLDKIRILKATCLPRHIYTSDFKKQANKKTSAFTPK